MIRRALLLWMLAAVATSTLLVASRADAQTPTSTGTPTPTATPATPPVGAISGTVTGRITSGTAGESVPDGLTVRLIALDGSNASTAAQATTKGGSYEVSAQVTPERTYVPYLVSQTVDYLGDPVTFTAAAPKAQRDFLVYGTTREAPQLTITSTSITLVAIDREAHQLGFVREDAIANPGDRVYIGNPEGVTLHFPVPDGTTEAAGEGNPEAFKFERGVLSAALPIRPGVLTNVVTRYLVDYDPAADTYRLRVTSPLPAEQIKVRVPAGYARLRATSNPAGGATNAPDEQAAGGAAGEVLKVMRSTASTQPGGGILVDLVGLSGHLQSNPLTDPTGAAAASTAALLVLSGGIFASLRWRARKTR